MTIGGSGLAPIGSGMSPGSGDDGTGVPGTGVRVFAGAKLIHQGSAFASGVDTFPGMSPSPAPVLLSGGAATAVPGIPATLSTSGKTPVGSTASISISGAPGAGAALLVGAPFPFVDVPLMFGPLGLTPSIIIVQPNLPASGTFSFGAPVPPLPPGLSSASIGMQAYVAPISGGPFALSNLSVFTAVIPGL